MKSMTKLVLLGLLTQSSPLGASTIWNPGNMVGLRTDGTVGGVFDGVHPSISDVDTDGVIDDGQTNFYTSLNVDSEGSASLDLAGDGFDWVLRFQMYDDDGVFGFTENFDDSVQVNVTPILSNTDLTSRGAAGPTFSDTSWNTRTYANYDFSADAGGGWFDVTVELDENAGGAQSASGIGFGFFDGNSTDVADFGGIGYPGGAGEVTFDTDPATGESFGVTTIPEPATSLLGLLALGGLAIRRR